MKIIKRIKKIFKEDKVSEDNVLGTEKKEIVMMNQPCYNKEGEFLGWWSRSTAVLGCFFAKSEKDNFYYVLASVRGTGTPDPEFVGCYNLVCGYLDFEETLKEAVIRETKEETGVDISDENIKFINYHDDPSEKRQNITDRFGAILKNSKEFYEAQFSHKDNEDNEVGEIKFIKLSEINFYKWAFNHDKLILPIFRTLLSNN